MTRQKLAALVDEAIGLDRQVQDSTARLKEIKADLIVEAEANGTKVETDGGGWSVVLDGTDGSIARVTQPGPRLKSTIDAESKSGAMLKAKLGKAWDRLFKPVMKYAPVDGFRDAVNEILRPSEAKATLKAVTTESAPAVAFEVKEIA